MTLSEIEYKHAYILM